MTDAGRAQREQVWLQAPRWYAAGPSNAQVAAESWGGSRQVGKCRQSRRRWRDRQVAVQSPARGPRLDGAQFARLETELNRAPGAHNHADDQRWALGQVESSISQKIDGRLTPLT
ncbi:hypothetical protein GCM10009527_057570 [Actinomadura nitritigenes]